MQEPAGYERCDAGRVACRVADVDWLRAAGLDTLAGAFAQPGERRGEVKSLARVPAPDGSTVFVKRYAFSPGRVWLRSALKWNFPVYSGPQELARLLELAAAGLRVPLPLAAGESEEGGRRRSYVALAELSGTPLSELPAPSTPAERRARVRAVAELARALHGAGFWHKDLYLCNLFWDPDQGLGLLDCERVERRAGGPRLRWRVKDLAALDYSAAWPSLRERLLFLRVYLGRGLRQADRRLARAIRRKAERIRRHGAKGP